MNNSRIEDILKTIQEQGEEIRNASITHLEIHEGSKNMVEKLFTDFEGMVVNNPVMRGSLFLLNIYVLGSFFTRYAAIPLYHKGKMVYRNLRDRYLQYEEMKKYYEDEKLKEKIELENIQKTKRITII